MIQHIFKVAHSLAAMLDVSVSSWSNPWTRTRRHTQFSLIVSDGCSGSACVPAAAVSFPVRAQTSHTAPLIDPSARSTSQQANADSNQMFRWATQRGALVFLRRFNWLAFSGAGSLESPPRSLGMEIHTKQGGRRGYIYLTSLTFILSERSLERALTTIKRETKGASMKTSKKKE